MVDRIHFVALLIAVGIGCNADKAPSTAVESEVHDVPAPTTIPAPSGGFALPSTDTTPLLDPGARWAEIHWLPETITDLSIWRAEEAPMMTYLKELADQSPGCPELFEHVQSWYTLEAKPDDPIRTQIVLGSMEPNDVETCAQRIASGIEGTVRRQPNGLLQVRALGDDLWLGFGTLAGRNVVVADHDAKTVADVLRNARPNRLQANTELVFLLGLGKPWDGWIGSTSTRDYGGLLLGVTSRGVAWDVHIPMGRDDATMKLELRGQFHFADRAAAERARSAAQTLTQAFETGASLTLESKFQIAATEPLLLFEFELPPAVFHENTLTALKELAKQHAPRPSEEPT